MLDDRLALMAYYPSNKKINKIKIKIIKKGGKLMA